MCAGGAGGTVAEFTRPGLECDPAAVGRDALTLERDGLTEPVMGWLRGPVFNRVSAPVSVGKRLPMSCASWVG